MSKPNTAVTHRLGFASASSPEDQGSDKLTSASLVLIHPPMPEIGLRRALLRDLIVVGRDETADLTIARSSISRRHAELRRIAETGGWELADMGSTNGTFVNDDEVEDATLADGDHVQFGDAIFKFVVGEAAAYHDKVYSLMVLDGLTSIHNQRYFFSHIDRQMVKAQQVKSDMALVIIDIDWFAELNEIRGEQCGECVLKVLARRIGAHIKSGDLAARIGGEEFAVFLPGAEHDDASELAERIRLAVNSEPFSFEGSDFDVSISAGVAASVEGELNAAQLIDVAKKQLRLAKDKGRNCIAP